MEFSGGLRISTVVSFLLVVGLIGLSGWSAPSWALDPSDADDGSFARDLRAQAIELLSIARFDEVHTPLNHGKRPAVGVPTNAFYNHILAGIHSNQRRGPIYEKLSHGASRPIMRRLVILQHLFLPLAWLVDLRSHRFQKQGIPIVSGDLMPVAGLPPPETPPRWHNCLNAEAANLLNEGLMSYRKACWGNVKTADFQRAAALTHKTLLMVEALENREGCHLALVKHFLESLGLTTLHAAKYVRQTQGAVIPLAKAFISVQLLPFGNALAMDLKAQVLHAQGVGILVNDVPAIPFEAEWASQDSPR